MTPAMHGIAAREPEEAFSRLTPAQADYLREWNDTGSAYPRDETIPALFEQEARRSPGAIALVPGRRGDAHGRPLNAEQQ